MFRNDTSNFYILKTNANDPYGIWDGSRPFRYELSTGDLHTGEGGQTFHVHGPLKTYGSVTFGAISAYYYSVTNSPSPSQEVIDPNGTYVGGNNTGPTPIATVYATGMIRTSDDLHGRNVAAHIDYGGGGFVQIDAGGTGHYVIDPQRRFIGTNCNLHHDWGDNIAAGYYINDQQAIIEDGPGGSNPIFVGSGGVQTSNWVTAKEFWITGKFPGMPIIRNDGGADFEARVNIHNEALVSDNGYWTGGACTAGIYYINNYSHNPVINSDGSINANNFEVYGNFGCQGSLNTQTDIWANSASGRLIINQLVVIDSGHNVNCWELYAGNGAAKAVAYGGGS
jgi:hypothetical protein